MRTRWKILGGTGVVTIWAAVLSIGQTGVVQGDTSDTSGAVAPPHNPHTPYPLGPGAIPYEELGVNDKAAVDSIQETIETSQPASSYEAWAAATAWTNQQAQAEIDARGVNLVGTAQDGVLP